MTWTDVEERHLPAFSSALPLRLPRPPAPSSAPCAAAAAATTAAARPRARAMPPGRAEPTVAVVLGVSACGKSAVARHLSAARGAAYVDADDCHSAAAVAKMSRGEALTDADRAPWLAAVARAAARAAAAAPRPAPFVALACSALSDALRATLRARIAEECADADVVFVHLVVPRPVIEARLRARESSGGGGGSGGGHFFAGADMAAAQFEKLEPLRPAADALVIDASPESGDADSVEKAAQLAWEFIEQRRRRRRARSQ